MDAALLVEEESSSVGAVDHSNDTQNTQSSSRLDLSPFGREEACEKHEHESQEDGDVRETDEEDRQVSHEEDEEKKPESEEMSPQHTDVQEEDMVSKREDCGQELKECEIAAGEKNDASQEMEEECIPQVTSAVSLQHEPDGDVQEESTELHQKDKKLDDNKKNEEKEVDENNMEEMDLQAVKETSEMNDEMDHESSEQDQKPKVTQVKEEDKQDVLVGTVVSGGEDIKSDSCAEIAMDVSKTEEKMEVADPEGGAEPFVNVGECSDEKEQKSFRCC